jgi:hypothetical protein
MTATPLPLDDALRPIAEAHQAAAADRARIEAERRAEDERKRDAESILRIYHAKGLAKARGMGKLYGWSKDQVDALCEPPTPPPLLPGGAGGDAGGGGDGASPPPAHGDDGPPRPTLKKQPVKPLPKDCPVTPLGTRDGACWYLDPHKQLLPPIRKHSADEMRGLFSTNIAWLWSNYPKFNERNGQHTGVKFDQAAESLIDACGRVGVFDPAEKLRGAGAWLAEDGGLIWHHGDEILTAEGWRKPGYLGAHIYPGEAPLPRPADSAGPDAARRLLGLLNGWPWIWADDDDAPFRLAIGGREDISPAALMLLGQVGCMLVGGALAWRPMVWVRGLEGSGKSTLQALIASVCGKALLSSSDATAAGIFQTIGFSSRAVAIDEAEADPNSQKMKAMVELVRQSASGGVVLRGSPDAKVRGFTARSAFLLSSIIIPPLNSQDLTRITILALGALTSITPPKLTPGEAAGIGAALRRRIIDHWPRWGETLERYREALRVQGHTARSCDQYGSLFAMADMLLFDGEPDSDTAYEWALTVQHLAGAAHRVTSSQSMLVWLNSKSIELFNTKQAYAVSTLVTIAAGLTPDGMKEHERPFEAGTALKTLREHGIFVDGAEKKATVTLPNMHAGLARLFDGTQWGTRGGAATSGWQQVMENLPGAKRAKSSRIGGRGWSAPVGVFLTEMEERA